MAGRRTDVVSEAIDALPGWQRWPVRGLTGIFRIVRAIVALQAIGGAVGVIIGALALDGRLVLLGFGQMIFAGVVLALNPGRETVSEVGGPQGAFVSRTKPRRAWRDAHGLQRLRLFVRGDRSWQVAVRKREDDPFGAVTLRHTVATEREALDLARDIEAQLRQDGADGRFL